MAFELPKLSYSYDALEPVIDAKTMEIHHLKHHSGYTNKLNTTLQDFTEFNDSKIEDLLKNLEDLPEQIRRSVRNNGGGYYNHTLYWNIMTPGGSNKPSGKLLEALINEFGTLEELKDIFTTEAIIRFGSGWAWISVDANNDIEVFSTPNQDNPLLLGQTPLIGIDVWEHAYYLNYQNKRPEYVKNWWNIINWDVATEIYNSL